MLCKQKTAYEILALLDVRYVFFFFQAEDGIRDIGVTGVQTCALPIETQSTAELLRRLQLGLAPFAPSQAEYLAILQGLLDVPGDNSLWQGLDPGQRKQRVFEAVRAIIRELCEKQPLMLICEDLHWFDSELLEFVAGLVREPPNAALFLVLTARDELPALKQAGAVSTQLLPLAPQLTDAMLRDLLGNAPELNALRALLTTRTYGNPVFIKRTVRSLI